MRWIIAAYLCLLSFAAQAQFNSFPPGVFTGRAALDAASGGGIATPTLILDKLDTAVNSGSATAGTTVDAPSGSLICVAVALQLGGNRTVTGFTDSAGNTYARAGQQTATAGHFSIEIWSTVATNDLPIGGTFTATTSAGQYTAAAFVQSNATAGVDASAGVEVTSATSLSVSTGVLAQANELVVAAFNPSNTLGTFTEDSNFTRIITTSPDSGDFVYRIVNSTASVTYGPSWTISVNNDAVVVSFK